MPAMPSNPRRLGGPRPLHELGHGQAHLRQEDVELQRGRGGHGQIMPEPH